MDQILHVMYLHIKIYITIYWDWWLLTFFICSMTHKRSLTAAQALTLCALCYALIHHERAITMTYMPDVPPFLNTCQFSPSKVLQISKYPSKPFLQDGCNILHHFINCSPYRPGFIRGTVQHPFFCSWSNLRPVMDGTLLASSACSIKSLNS